MLRLSGDPDFSVNTASMTRDEEVLNRARIEYASYKYESKQQLSSICAAMKELPPSLSQVPQRRVQRMKVQDTTCTLHLRVDIRKGSPKVSSRACFKYFACTHM